jgi:2-C-methyl-D-erythritol 2,4-cyclodiphosphate synthase
VIRIGQSVDIHQLCEGRDLIIGGVKIPYEKGLLGHSDADVLLHAAAESLLGALALKDLGTHFPDTDPAWKGADSMKILAGSYALIKERGWRLVNLDATILAEKPKMAPYIDQMQANIASVLECEKEQVSVKATRGEKMGFVGRQEGIAAICVCLIEKV